MNRLLPLFPQHHTSPASRPAISRDHRTTPAQRRTPLPALILALLTTLLVAGCVLVAPYDAIIDQSINDLHLRTIVFLDRMQRTGGSFEDNRGFYDEAHGAIAAIKIRAAMLPKNDGTLKNLGELDGQFDRLAALHKIRPLTGTASTSPAQIARQLLESNFRSLTQIELHKKLGAAVPAPAAGQPAS